MKKLKEFKLPSVNNIQIGDIGFRFRKDFIGHGIFEGQVIEINNNLRRCIYSDGDIEDLNLEKLSYLNSNYLPSKKRIDYKVRKKDQVIDRIIDPDPIIINENLNEIDLQIIVMLMFNRSHQWNMKWTSKRTLKYLLYLRLSINRYPLCHKM